MSDPGISIGELASRTGLAPATLRAWESRYGFPVPERNPGGRRSYRSSTIGQLRQIVADREAGLGLPAAIDRAQTSAQAPGPSLNAFLRRQAPSLLPRQFTKRALTALTRALEDEGHSRAGRTTLVAAGFQHRAHYERVRSRWDDLVAGAHLAMVFSDFTTASQPGDTPIRIPVGRPHQLNQEWFVIWHSDRFTACLSGRELPGQARLPESERILETVWTMEDALVTVAAEAVVALARQSCPDLRVPDAPTANPHLSTADSCDALYAVTNRMLAQLS